MTFPLMPSRIPLAVLGELVFIAANTSSTATVTVPTCQSGDLAIFVTLGQDGSTDPSEITTPSGWTKLSGFLGTATDHVRCNSYAKILTAADSGVTLTGINGGTNDYQAVLLFRGDAKVSAISAALDLEQAITGANPAARTISAASAATAMTLSLMLCHTRGSQAGSVTHSPTMTLGASIGSPGGFRLYCLAQGPVSVSDIAVDMNDSGTVNFQLTYYLEVS